MTERVPIDKTVMVLGSTPEAAKVSTELLALGYTVHWVFLDAGPLGSDIDHPQLYLHEGTALISLEGHVGGFIAGLDHGGERASVAASALVVATGNERYFPVESYGVSLSANVLTVAQLGSRLEAARGTPVALSHRDERVILLLDLDGETSREMTIESLRVASVLREVWRSVVYVYYRDLLVDTWGLERMTREMRERGIVFCRYDEPELVVDDGEIRIRSVEGPMIGNLLVLPEAVRPRRDAEALAELLQVRIGEDGYFQEMNIHRYRPGLSLRRGIFFAGRCHIDCDVASAEADALQAVANVDALLATGYLEPEDIIAHVDSSKCVRCLTCIRSCPHVAVEMADYDDVTAARVVDLACQGCGVCVVNCPVQAIELVGQTTPAWMVAG